MKFAEIDRELEQNIINSIDTMQSTDLYTDLIKNEPGATEKEKKELIDALTFLSTNLKNLKESILLSSNHEFDAKYNIFYNFLLVMTKGYMDLANLMFKVLKNTKEKGTK